jgi:nickel-dependent lactate racemase
MVDCWLPYGETEIYVSVDANHLLGFADPNNISPEKPEHQIIEEALLEPSGGRTLDSYIDSNCTVAIALEGTTPPRIATIVLSTLVKQIIEQLVPKDKITIIVANDIKHNSNPNLIKALKSENALFGVRLHEHTRNSKNLVEVGSTNQGTTVLLNDNYQKASLKIAVGLTRVDHYTGFTGAYSAVVPGISGYDTVLSNRKHFFQDKSAPGLVELNPIKEDVIEAVKLGGIDFAVNLVPNYQKQLLSVCVGELEESWSKSINRLGSDYEIEVTESADIAIVSAGGLEFDRSFYSAIWAIDIASKIVKRNGSIILLAECSDGLGADAFTSLARIEQLSEFKRRYDLGAETLLMMKKVLKNNRVFLVSALPGYLVEPLGIEVARTANEAYNMVVGSRRGRKTTIIPYGCSTTLKSS